MLLFHNINQKQRLLIYFTCETVFISFIYSCVMKFLFWFSDNSSSPLNETENAFSKIFFLRLGSHDDAKKYQSRRDLSWLGSVQLSPSSKDQSVSRTLQLPVAHSSWLPRELWKVVLWAFPGIGHWNYSDTGNFLPCIIFKKSKI